MQQSKNDFWVGLFVMLGAAALVFLALESANLLQLKFQTGYRVTARFGNIGRLKPQAEVDKQYAFPKDSSLNFLTSGLLGEQYIGIEAGADENNLAAGDNLTATQSAVVLENLIGQFLYSKAEEGGTPSDAGRKK